VAGLHAANPEPHAAAVGRHLFLAGDWARASVALRQAGDVARARGAWSNARVCFEDALVALRLRHFLRGAWAQVIEIAESARALASARSVGLWLRPFTVLLGTARAHAGRVAEAVAVLEAEVGLSLRVYRSRWLGCLAEAYLLQRDAGKAAELATQSLMAARERGERGREASALWLLGEAARLRDAGDGTAASHLQESLALAEELDQRPLVAHCRASLGALHRHTGRQEQARAHLAAATAMYGEMGMTYWLARTAPELGALGDR
jgi:tetratricopeptide (TPR) repeat protein